VFSERNGCKSLEAYCSKIDVYWDLSSSWFCVGHEPFEGFFVGVVVDKQMVLSSAKYGVFYLIMLKYLPIFDF
jgi:hypothetical protein